MRTRTINHRKNLQKTLNKQKTKHKPLPPVITIHVSIRPNRARWSWRVVNSSGPLTTETFSYYPYFNTQLNAPAAQFAIEGNMADATYVRALADAEVLPEEYVVTYEYAGNNTAVLQALDSLVSSTYTTNPNLDFSLIASALYYDSKYVFYKVVYSDSETLVNTVTGHAEFLEPEAPSKFVDWALDLYQPTMVRTYDIHGYDPNSTAISLGNGYVRVHDLI